MAEDTRPRAAGDLTGRVAVVTGAARGIGRAAAVALAGRGAAVAGIDVAGPVSPILDFPAATPGDMDTTGEAVRGAGGRWLAVTADQRDIGAIRSAAMSIEREWGGVDIVFANAGIRVIITSSTQGQHGTKFGSSYSASKWGLIGLMKSAALELGSYGITVNAVIPGLIDTALTRHEDRYAQAISSGGQEPTGDPGRDEETARKLLAASSPLGVPWIDPADVAPVVAFLASDEARMVSGASFAVTAGDSAHVTA